MTDTVNEYYMVDDIFVKVYEDGEDIVAINHWGNPYPPFKAAVEGIKVTRARFESAVESRQGLPIPVRSEASLKASA